MNCQEICGLFRDSYLYFKSWWRRDSHCRECGFPKCNREKSE